ncbi:MAG: sugar ABC transporter permease [Anaerolineae bacterium]|nr:sugar ABC transporter permease [Anaerolineae bacterium]
MREMTIGVRTRRGPSPQARREWLAAYAFLTPQILGLLIFLAGPLIVSIYYTFTKWDLVAPAPTWIGLANWQHLLEDPRIGKVLWNTVRFILTGTTGFLVLSLAVALLVNQGLRGTAVMRTLFFLPWVLSQVAVGTTWKWLLNTRSGPIVQAFKLFGLRSPEWLLDARYAMIAIAMATTWQALGFGMTIYLAGLQGIPQHLYDAAKVDGANAWQRFRYVTFPSLSPVIFFLTVTSLIGAFQLYDPVVMMTSGGVGIAPGGPKDSTRTIVLYLQNQMFSYSEKLSGLGYAATIAWVLAALIFVVTLIQWRAARWWVFYGGEED